MGAHVIGGRGLAAGLKGRLAAEVADFMEVGVVPGLATVLVGSPAEAEAHERRVRKPAGSLGFLRNATVISCDEHAHNAGRLAEFTKQADVLIVAAGVPGLIKKEHVREGVIAIDVGINSRRDPHTGKESFEGDLDFAGVAIMAEALSPVPGGVGPITDAWSLKNTAAARVFTRAEETRRSLEPADAGKNGIVGVATIPA